MKDRRSELRYPVRQAVTITDLTHDRESFPGFLVDISERGMRLLVDRRVPLETPVRVETGDILFLGEVCYCNPEGDAYSIGLALEHCLSDLMQLARLTQSVYQE
jgi:hypothetical protein